MSDVAAACGSLEISLCDLSLLKSSCGCNSMSSACCVFAAVRNKHKNYVSFPFFFLFFTLLDFFIVSIQVYRLEIRGHFCQPEALRRLPRHG